MAGDIVTLSDSESAVRKSFENGEFKEFLFWSDGMKVMLGNQFPVLETFEDGMIGLPSPDGSQNGTWYFYESVVQVTAGTMRNTIDVENIILFYEYFILYNMIFKYIKFM